MSQNQESGYWEKLLYQLFLQYGITKVVFRSSNNYEYSHQNDVTVEIDTSRSEGLQNRISVPTKPRTLRIFYKDGKMDDFVNDLAILPKMLTFQLDVNKLNETGYQVVYENLKRHLEQNKNDEQRRAFTKFTQNINQQLANSFYKDLDIAVNMQMLDNNGRVLFDDTKKTNYKNKNNKIKIQFFLHEDGSITANHQFSEDYLKEFEDRWKNEAKARGMDVDVPQMRQDIIDYLNSDMAEKSFSDRFLQEVKSWYKDGVGNYLKAIQATQKVTTHIWEEGTINRGVWHSAGDDAQEYQQFPDYIHLTPVLGGATDGVVDEIVGIKVACVSIYEIVADEEKQKAFAQVFTKEGFNNLMDGLENQATGILNDPQRQQHFAGQTTISVASMFVGAGAITKIGKLDELGELVEVAAKKGDEFVDGATTLSKIDELKKLARHIENDKAVDELIKEFGTETFESKLDDLIEVARNTEKKADFWKNARKFIIRGNKFNDAVRDLFPPKYKFHEVVIEHPTLKYLDGPDIGNPKRFRLDSYTHKKYIVSRKATDFDQIKPETFRGYLDELLNKYPPGAKIVSTRKEIRHKTLTGELIMEVPLSNKTSIRLKEFEKIMQEKKYKQIKLVFEKE